MEVGVALLRDAASRRQSVQLLRDRRHHGDLRAGLLGEKRAALTKLGDRLG